ncbi:hypothetical protein BDZ45DRAFT_753773 [Acephala macrosclerotiorum]|nr:hypothetical protein BDZ45DRAFT_753773 [Acephala macrosclerotiorum]
MNPRHHFAARQAVFQNPSNAFTFPPPNGLIGFNNTLYQLLPSSVPHTTALSTTASDSHRNGVTTNLFDLTRSNLFTFWLYNSGRSEVFFSSDFNIAGGDAAASGSTEMLNSEKTVKAGIAIGSFALLLTAGALGWFF